ncbi:MAG: type II secretion system F family protein [Armatimonadetes bacterium]|nr:type II secretion system F family protein [Armatimonadota bacterium]
MTQFIFKARNNLGHKSSGIINTINKETAIKILSERNLLVTKLIEVKLNHSKNILNIFKGGKLHIKTENLLTFTQELGAMLNAGISLKQAIDMMIADMEVSPLRQILLDLANGLNSGNTFSDTLNNHPEIFSKLYISMIQA